jgi:hypothetical protein
MLPPLPTKSQMDDEECYITTSSQLLQYLDSHKNINNQKRLMNMLRSVIQDEHEDLLTNQNNNTRVHYVSIKHPASGRWLLCRETNLFSHHDFSTVMSSRLNLPLPSLMKTDTTYCLCSLKRKVDHHGNHLLACSSIPNDANSIKRHNKILDLIYDLCKEARLSPSKEVKHLFNNDKRVDLFLPTSYLHQQSSVVLDLIITHSTPDINLVTKQPEVNIKEDKISKKLQLAYNDKIDTYQEDADSKNLLLIPLVMESHGAMHPEMDKFIYKCCDAIADNIGSTVQKVLTSWRAKISSHLQSWNARTLRERIARIYNSGKEIDEDKVEIEHMLHSEQQ